MPSMKSYLRPAQVLSVVAERARASWAQLGLSRQFTIATSAIMIVGMLTVGHWLAGRIEDAVIDSNAVAAALYADSFIESRVQVLASQSKLTPQSEQELDALLLPQAVGQPVVGFRIWKGDTIVYSDRRELNGRTFPPSSMRQRAWSGHVAADYGHLDDPSHAPVGTQPILEIYAPVRETGTSRIIALAETYQMAPALPDEIAKARVGSWMIVGFVTLSMLFLQSMIVRKGSRTIREQRESLAQQITELSRLLRENDALRQRANQANSRVAEMNERFLRRIGADLHDGPVQLIGTTILRLDALSDAVANAGKSVADDASEDISVMREALLDTMTEIRNLSAGLALPEIEKLSLADTLRMVARRHEERTGTRVTCEICEQLPREVRFSLKACLYRFAQEGLNNALRHAGGTGQAITAGLEGDCLEVNIVDAGPGIRTPCPEQGGQGLIGLRNRIESLGGKFCIGSQPEGGTCLTVQFRLSQGAREMEALHV